MKENQIISDDFKHLFWLIFTEHAGLQLCIYLSMVFVIPVVGALVGHSFISLLWMSCALASAMKLLSALSSSFKSFLIISRCKKGDHRFLTTYKEWTGNHYQ